MIGKMLRKNNMLEILDLSLTKHFFFPSFKKKCKMISRGMWYWWWVSKVCIWLFWGQQVSKRIGFRWLVIFFFFHSLSFFTLQTWAKAVTSWLELPLNLFQMQWSIINLSYQLEWVCARFLFTSNDQNWCFQSEKNEIEDLGCKYLCEAIKNNNLFRVNCLYFFYCFISILSAEWWGVLLYTLNSHIVCLQCFFILHQHWMSPKKIDWIKSKTELEMRVVCMLHSCCLWIFHNSKHWIYVWHFSFFWDNELIFFLTYSCDSWQHQQIIQWAAKHFPKLWRIWKKTSFLSHWE